MNKIAKILSVVLSVSLVVGVSVAMLVSAFAASTPKFSISVIEETKDSVKVALNLEDGSITSCGVMINASDWNNPKKSTGLTVQSIARSQLYKDFYSAHEDDKIPPQLVLNSDTGKAALASTVAYSSKGTFLIYTFTKTNSAKAKIDSSDIVVEFDGVVDGDNKPVASPALENKIPAPSTTKPTTSTTKPTTSTTKPTTSTTKPTTSTTKPTTSTTKPTTSTTKPTEPTVKPTEPTVKPTEPTAEPTEPTVKPTEPTVEPTEPTAEPTTKADDTTAKADDTTAKADDVVTTAPAADTTTAAASTGDVVNPETGDRLTASAAVVALLAISGAAVVALRKKED